MVTKKDGAASATPAMTSELLKKMAEEQQNKEKKGGGDNKGKDAPGENGDNAPDATDGEPDKKKAKMSAEEKGGGGGEIRVRFMDSSHENLNISQVLNLMNYRVAHLVANLGWVDVDLCCSTLCIVLPGALGCWEIGRSG